MPKVNVSLEAAKAKDGDILAKLNHVRQVSQSHRQNTKLAQQRLDWTEQGSRLASEARRLESDLWELAASVCPEAVEASDDSAEEVRDAWFQVGGVRRLLGQLQQRDPSRVRAAPAQALSLQEVLAGVSAAMKGRGERLDDEVAALERECGNCRRAVRQELLAEGAWEKSADADQELSDGEEALLEKLAGEEAEAYSRELGRLNEELRAEVASLEAEQAELRQKCRGWDEGSHLRFMGIKRQLQGKQKLLMDRLCLEFPHLSQEQLHAHGAACDALKFNAQKQSAAFRQWRRDRAALLQKCRVRHAEATEAREVLAARRLEHQGQRQKQRALHSRLEVERAKASALQAQRLAQQELEEKAARERPSSRSRSNQGPAFVPSCAARIPQHRAEVPRKAEVPAPDPKEQQERMRHNAEVVQLRRQMYELKQREQAKQRQDAEREQQERAQRLQQALEKLQVKAPRDPSRLHKLPARLEEAAYNDPLVCVTRGPHAGFDEKRLMNDARYKLSAALQAAGLFHTPAAQEALAAVPAPRPHQPHIVSQVFAAGYP